MEIEADENSRRREKKRIEEEHDREIIRNQERQILKERLQAELKMTEKKQEMEKAARVTQAKLPKLKITQFNGTTSDWARFENMFVTVETCTKLKLRPARHELKEIITVNSSTKTVYANI